MPWKETEAVEGSAWTGESPFLVHSGLNFTDFIAENIDRLSFLNYGNLHGGPAPPKVGEVRA